MFLLSDGFPFFLLVIIRIKSPSTIYRINVLLERATRVSQSIIRLLQSQYGLCTSCVLPLPPVIWMRKQGDGVAEEPGAGRTGEIGKCPGSRSEHRSQELLVPPGYRGESDIFDNISWGNDASVKCLPTYQYTKALGQQNIPGRCLSPRVCQTCSQSK